MAAPLKELARFMRKQVGVRFNPLGNEAFTCGKVLDLDGLIDMDVFDDLADPDMKVPLPPILGPMDLTIPNLEHSRGLKLQGSAAAPVLTSVGVDGSLAGALDRAVTVTFSFTDVTTKYMEPGALQAHIKAATWTDRLAAALDDPDRHIVTQEYWGKVTLDFEKNGEGHLDLEAEVPNIASVKAGGKWTFSGTAKLQSTKDILFALETARYNRHAGQLVSTS